MHACSIIGWLCVSKAGTHAVCISSMPSGTLVHWLSYDRTIRHNYSTLCTSIYLLHMYLLAFRQSIGPPPRLVYPPVHPQAARASAGAPSGSTLRHHNHILNIQPILIAAILIIIMRSVIIIITISRPMYRNYRH
jgi:hypothetical protein